MTLDVVVVTYQSADLLRGALAGLPTDARVIVVDNASSDGSAEVARGYGADVIESPVNAGFGAAANIGVRHGSGDLVLLLNPDARVDATMVETLCQRLLDDPGLAVVSPHLRTPGGGEQRVWWPFPSAAGAWREATGLHRLGGAEPDEGFVIGACFLVRRSVFEALGGFDERFWLYGEECDLCRRAVDAGWRIGLAGDLFAEHSGGASGSSVPDLVFEHFERGGEHFVAKREGRRGLVSYRLANLVGATVRSVLPGPPERRHLHRARSARQRGVLRRHPTAVALDSPATAAPGSGIVVCSLEAWDEVWRRNQFLVRELLESDPNRRVLFVEPPFDLLHELRSPGARHRKRGLRPLTADGRVVRLEPLKLLPRRLGRISDRLVRRQVRTAAQRLGFVDPRLWINDARYAGLATETGWPALYDITDDWTLFGAGRQAALVERSERKLLAECGAVVVCSPELLRSRSADRDDVVLVPNAVDVDHLRAPQPRPEDLPPSPVVVYVGSLHDERLDVDLIERLADAAPSMQIVLVGPNGFSDRTNDKLRTHPNLHLLGPRPYRLVPAYLQHADAIVVPHLITPFTESLDPIKAYECLAVERPTVATPVAGFREAGGGIHCAEGQEFVDAVTAAVAGELPGGPPTSPPSWSDRGRRFEEVLFGTSEPRAVKVAFIDHCARLSGAELALARMVPALIDEGVECHVILGEHGPLEDALIDAGASVEVLPLDDAVRNTPRADVRPGWALVRRVVSTSSDVDRLRRRLLDLQPDLVHTNSLKAALYGGIAGRLAGVPVIWHVRDRIASDYLPRPAVVLVRGLAKVLPKAIIANSATTRATLGAVARSDVVPSPVVYDSQAISAREGSRAVGGPFHVAIVGRLAPWKGQDVFLEAFALAFSGGDERALVVGSAMFGEDDFEAELRSLVDRLGIADQVEFTGFVTDVPELLRSVDCVVHASVLPEPFGQVVLEGMAAGLPVIASREGGPAEVITDGVDGLLCPPGDPTALAKLMSRLASDIDERERLGRAARARAQDFTPEVVAREVVAVYRAVLRRRSSTRS